MNSPEQADDTLVQVGVAEVVARDPNITSVSDQLRHQCLPLAMSRQHPGRKIKGTCTYARRALPFSRLSSSARTFSSGVFSLISFLAATWERANLLPSARSLTREEADEPIERRIPMSQHRIEIRWIATSRLDLVSDYTS